MGWLDTNGKRNEDKAFMGNNAVWKVVGISTMKVKMYYYIIYTFSNMKYIPDLKKNLISLGTLDETYLIYSSLQGLISDYKEKIFLTTYAISWEKCFQVELLYPH